MFVNLNDVINAIEQTTDRQEFMFHTLTGEIIPSENADNSEDWIQLPTKQEIDDYGNMESFIENQTGGEAKTWLSNAIHGRGAFRMFRATLERFGLTREWYDYLEQMHRATAMEWCEYYGIEYDLLPDENDEEDFDEEDDSFDRQPVRKEMPKPSIRLTAVSRNNLTSVLYMAEDCCKCRKQLVGDRSPADQEVIEEHLKAMMKDGAVITAASDMGRFVGYCVVKEGNPAVLEEIYVRPEYRRRGIGKMLLEDAEANGFLQIDVEPNNEDMLNFLNRNGYGTLRAVRLEKNRKKCEEEYTLNSHHLRSVK